MAKPKPKKKPAPKNVSRGIPLAFQKKAAPAKPKTPAKKAAAVATKKPAHLSKQESKIYDQEEADIKKEGKASPKQLNKLIKQVTEDQYKEEALSGIGHPDAQALIKAGVSPATVTKLAQQYAPSHPAAQAANSTLIADPTNPQQYTADVLQLAGLPDTASNEALLEQQESLEGMPGGEDNPLATTVKGPGSTSVNSAGVQEFPNLFEGATAEAATLKQKNMQSIYDALASGSETPSEYSAALANSDYEGLGGASNPANVAYAQSYLGDSPEASFPGGGAVSGSSGGGGGGGSTLGTDALAQAMSTNSFGGLASIIPSLGTASANNSLQTALQGLSSSPEAAVLQANTSDAPGSPDQTPSQAQQTQINPASTYQAQLAALLGAKLQPGTAGKTNG